MDSTRFSVGSGSENKMVMVSGCDTGYFIRDGSVYKSGCSTDLSVNNAGEIYKGGTYTGYVISGGSILKESDKGYNIEWMFS